MIKQLLRSASKTTWLLLALIIALGLAMPATPSRPQELSDSPRRMPPHPDLLQKVRNGELTLPDMAVDSVSKAEKGIDQPVTVAAGPVGAWRALAILVQFSDMPAVTGASSFDTLLFGTQTGSLKDYYKKVSYGVLDIVTVNLPSSLGWRAAPQTYQYYVNGNYGWGAYPRNAQRLAEDAVYAANPYVDFSKYDNNNDGYVDTVFIIHAGQGAELTGKSADIWSHSWSTYNAPRVDGKWVSSYTTEPEYWLQSGDMTVGVYAHELGHAFGLPDLYDTDYSSAGVGEWSLMSGGSWNGPGWPGGGSPAFPDAWTRAKLKYLTPKNVISNSSGVNIPAAETSKTVYRLWTNGAGGSQYFLVENRQQIGYDTYLPGAGLLIWHVDETRSTNTSECRQVNNWLCSYSHFKVALEQADNLLELENNWNRGNAGDAYPGSASKRNFTFSTKPNSSSYSSSSRTYVGITSISNSSSNMKATFQKKATASAAGTD